MCIKWNVLTHQLCCALTNNFPTPGLDTQLQQDMATITDTAQRNDWVVKDLPMDGNSMFSAVIRQLSGVHPHCTEEHSHYTVETLQRAVADYLIENPFQEHPLACQEFLSLRRIDRMALTGIAGLLSATIHLVTPDICFIDINDCDSSTHIFLAIVGEGHIVSLEPHRRDDATSSVVVEMPPLPSHSTEDICNDLQSNAGHSDSRSEDKQTDEDREHAEDELAQEHQVGLRGLAYETCLQREDIDGGADDIFCVAPGEGKKPISIAKDEFFEEMFNPTKYPSGEGGLKTPRDTKVTDRKYFNQRLLDADGRFGKDIEYLLTVQYMVEDKQVHDAENIAMRQAQGRRHRGAALTAGSVKNKEVLRQMVQRDDAYKFLKNVRGSPAYFQQVQYQVLALIRQLGLPTWFFTLSAADMQWPDVIQTIARQYGTTFTDEDVKNMSFEEKSKWLGQNPVTAARHFQYRLNTFFHKFLKSKAHPLGELVDYAIRIEFQARGSPHAHTILWIKDAPKFGIESD